MQRILDEFEAEWIKAAGRAFVAIRLVTGYGARSLRTLDPETTYAVNQIADLLHNLEQIGTGNTWWRDHHTPERLETLRKMTDELEHMRHARSKPKPGLLSRITRAVTGRTA